MLQDDWFPWISKYVFDYDWLKRKSHRYWKILHWSPHTLDHEKQEVPHQLMTEFAKNGLLKRQELGGRLAKSIDRESGCFGSTSLLEQYDLDSPGKFLQL